MQIRRNSIFLAVSSRSYVSFESCVWLSQARESQFVTESSIESRENYYFLWKNDEEYSNLRNTKYPAALKAKFDQNIELKTILKKTHNVKIVVFKGGRTPNIIALELMKLRKYYLDLDKK